MENCLVKDEIFTTKINNETALHYEKNIDDKKLYIDPLFNKWLTEQKEKKGKNGLLCHSSKDKLYFYFESINDENDIKKWVILFSIFVNIVEVYIIMILIVVIKMV